HRSDRYRRRRGDHPGSSHLRSPGRGRAWPPERQASGHRHRAPRFLGTGPLLQSGARIGRRAGQGQPMIYLVALLGLLSLGGMAFAFAGGDERSQKRIQALAKPKDVARSAKGQFEAQKRKNLAALLEDVEKNQAAQRKQEKPTLRRRLEQAGFGNASPRSFWIFSG